MKKENNSSVYMLLKKMILIMGVINVFFYLLSLIWGFSIKMLLGFVVGFIYVCLCYVFVARTVVNAVEMPQKKAKRSVISCYVIRCFGLFLLCFIALEFKIFNVIGIIIPQFYPKMAIGLITFMDNRAKRKE